jgi:hypothetical protein
VFVPIGIDRPAVKRRLARFLAVCSEERRYARAQPGGRHFELMSRDGFATDELMTIVWTGTQAGNISMRTQFVNQCSYAMTERGSTV